MKKLFAFTLSLLSGLSVVSVIAPTQEVRAMNPIEREEIIPPASRPLGFHYHNQTHFYIGHHDANLKGNAPLYAHQGLSYPKIPLFHPYDPLDHERIDTGILSAPLSILFPASAYGVLPHQIIRKMRERGVNPATSLRISLLAQNFPWRDGTAVCFRPQYGTDGMVPAAGTRGYNVARPIETGLFGSDTGTHFAGALPDTFIRENTSVHDDGASAYTILSGNRPHAAGMRAAADSLWSAVFYKDGETEKAIVTLHWILDDAQLESLRRLLDLARISTHNHLETTLRNLVRYRPSFQSPVEKARLLLEASRDLRAPRPLAPLAPPAALAAPRVAPVVAPAALAAPRVAPVVAPAAVAAPRVAPVVAPAALAAPRVAPVVAPVIIAPVATPARAVRGGGTKAKASRVRKAKAPRVRKAKAPRVRKAKAPRIRKAKAPRVRKAKAPRIRKVKAPRIRKVKAPRVRKAKAPRIRKVKAPRIRKAKAPRARRARSRR